uniref:Uncharacterized protein n=1 Tax=Panagrolaimus sp. ES5 TaxID=591445 RepID=A0AC34GVP5_9BILA
MSDKQKSAHDVHEQGLDEDYETHANYQNEVSSLVKCYPKKDNANSNYQTEKISVKEWYERREENQNQK